MFLRFIISVIVIICSVGLQAQNDKKIDSLKAVIKSNVHDTIKIKAIIQWDDIIYISNPKLDADLNQQIIDISRFNIKKGASKNEILFYKKTLANALNILGITNDNNGAYTVALDYYYQSLKYAEDIDDIEMIGGLYNNIGLIHNVQLDYDNAFSFYAKSLDIKIKAEDKRGIATTLNNMGNIYLEKKEIDSALLYYGKSLAIAMELNDDGKIGSTLDNIGLVYRRMELLDSAIVYFQKSIDYLEKIADWEALSNSLFNLGMVYLNTERSKLAIKICKKGFNLAKKFEGVYRQSLNCECLYLSYKKIGKIDSALYYFEILDTLADFLTNDENTRLIAQKEISYKHQKEVVADSIKHQNEMQLSKAKLEKVQVEKKNANLKLMLVLLCVLVLLILGFLIFNRLKVERKQKLLIEYQKEKVEEKNKEIMDSINYAKRIQNALLPSTKVVNELLQDSFILYKPKDIVAGDFYWLEHVSYVIESVPIAIGTKQSAKEEKIASDSSSHRNDGPIEQSRNVILFAAADCTGHGVPGAMVSVVCNNGLNRSVREHGLTDPGLILDKTREIVIQEFEKSEEDVKDGMDIALCSLQGTTLQYAGANNPLWIIRKGEVVETKANKQPIGKYDNQFPYTTHSFDLHKGDAIYIFSDGFVDQFGGEKGKKFKSKAFRDLLISIQSETMTEQLKCLDDAFENWRGDLEQIDDVCVIGVRI